MPSARDQVRRFIRENFLLGADADQLGDSDSLLEKRILDSTGFIELVSFLESEFAIRIEDEEMVPGNLDSIASIDTYVARKRGV
jgi:acyl carrier protein